MGIGIKRWWEGKKIRQEEGMAEGRGRGKERRGGGKRRGGREERKRKEGRLTNQLFMI